MPHFNHCEVAAHLLHQCRGQIEGVNLTRKAVQGLDRGGEPDKEGGLRMYTAYRGQFVMCK